MFISSTASSAAVPSLPTPPGTAAGESPAAGRPWRTAQERMLLASRPENVRDTRSWLRAVLERWAVSEDSAQSAMLLLSERVGNAVLHARDTSRVLVTARLRWGLVECEVEDQDPNWGTGRTGRGTAEAGVPGPCPTGQRPDRVPTGRQDAGDHRRRTGRVRPRVAAVGRARHRVGRLPPQPRQNRLVRPAIHAGPVTGRARRHA
ncbi:ATP-binding protein [Streptomyces sp. NPDC096205]|uniref:ATP-binding protein n=1 Tax=Streptomyces sp. NPDC096205 TaxID=3366081 RepID=UPI003813E8EF